MVADNTRRKMLASILVLLTATPAMAQSVADLGSVQGETIMLRARAEREKALGELQEASGAGASKGTLESSGPPTLLGVFGSHDKIYARFSVDGSSGIDVRKGESFFGGYRVEQLSINDVVLTKGGRRWTLRMPGAGGDANDSARVGAPPAGGRPLPTLPTMPAPPAMTN